MDKFAYKYLFVEHKIRKFIRNLKVDTKLNGERTIAKDLGISYMTVRKAVDNLVVEGVLYKVPKRGAYVAERAH
jgi:DNA-binding GntR family transcriptional regulator